MRWPLPSCGVNGAALGTGRSSGGLACSGGAVGRGQTMVLGSALSACISKRSGNAVQPRVHGARASKVSLTPAAQPVECATPPLLHGTSGSPAQACIGMEGMHRHTLRRPPPRPPPAPAATRSSWASGSRWATAACSGRRCCGPWACPRASTSSPGAWAWSGEPALLRSSSGLLNLVLGPLARAPASLCRQRPGGPAAADSGLGA